MPGHYIIVVDGMYIGGCSMFGYYVLPLFIIESRVLGRQPLRVALVGIQ